MRVEPITFQAGVNLLDDSGKTLVDTIAQLLSNNYPNYRVAVRGHTGKGDEAANKQLSLERAESVTQYLKVVHGIDGDRLHSEGCGSTKPPLRNAGESTRAYNYRLPRVEFVLLEANNL